MERNVNANRNLQEIRIKTTLSYENTVTEGTNLRRMKHVRHDESFGSFALK